MHLQKPESEYTKQGYLFLMEKSEWIILITHTIQKSYFLNLFNRGFYGNVVEILLHVQEGGQAIYLVAVQPNLGPFRAIAERVLDAVFMHETVIRV